MTQDYIYLTQQLNELSLYEGHFIGHDNYFLSFNKATGNKNQDIQLTVLGMFYAMLDIKLRCKVLWIRGIERRVNRDSCV